MKIFLILFLLGISATRIDLRSGLMNYRDDSMSQFFEHISGRKDSHSYRLYKLLMSMNKRPYKMNQMLNLKSIHFIK